MIPDDEKIMEIQDEIQGMDYQTAKAEFPLILLDEFFEKFGSLSPTGAEMVVDLNVSDVSFQFDFVDKESADEAKEAVRNEIYSSMPDWAQLGVITDDYRLLALPLFREAGEDSDFEQIIDAFDVGERMNDIFPKSVDNIFTTEKTIDDKGKVFQRDGYFTLNVLGGVDGEEYAKSIIAFNQTRVNTIYEKADVQIKKQIKTFLKENTQNGKSKNNIIKE